MILLNKTLTYKTLLLACFGLFFSFQNQAQNLFDKAHTEQFVSYLLRTRQYDYASLEIERLLHFSPQNDSIKALLLKTYRASEKFDKGIARAQLLFPAREEISAQPAYEYARLLIESEKYMQTDSFLTQNQTLSFGKKARLRSHWLVKQCRWAEADTLLRQNIARTPELGRYQPFVEQGLRLKYKKPGVAALFSAVVPGAGKVYTSYWKDGAMAFATIGMASWQSYNGFRRDGIKSAYGWVFGSLAAVFYLSNIYGSFKSAKTYNREQERKILRQFRLEFGIAF